MTYRQAARILGNSASFSPRVANLFAVLTIVAIVAMRNWQQSPRLCMGFMEFAKSWRFPLPLRRLLLTQTVATHVGGDYGEDGR